MKVYFVQEATVSPRSREEGIEFVLKQAKDQNVKFIKLWFTDILGMLKSFAITPNELENAMTIGMGFDGSSIEGFLRIDESDMVAKPDPDTWVQLTPEKDINPENSSQINVARMFCNIYLPNGEPFVGDPRYILKRNLQKAAEKGYTFYVGPELEFFYFKDRNGTEYMDKGGYFDASPLDAATPWRRETILAMENVGIVVEYSHHEVAPSQHEIDMRYTDALSMADNVMTYRLIVKEVALKNGIYATFMPKPVQHENGSGMHVHQSLFKDGRNAFFDASDPMNLSAIAKSYIAGLLKYAPEFTAVTNQWVNSYKRLIPGYEAPVYLSWARRNRSDLIRVPEYQPGRENATRIEYRAADPACNPYLTFSVMLAAGLKGIEDGLAPPAPVEENVYQMTEEQRKKRNIGTLPESLHQALLSCEQSKLIRETLGDHLFDNFIANKKAEFAEYRSQVTQWELDKYLEIL
jgi:glutamine synthetase